MWYIYILPLYKYRSRNDGLTEFLLSALKLEKLSRIRGSASGQVSQPWSDHFMTCLGQSINWSGLTWSLIKVIRPWFDHDWIASWGRLGPGQHFLPRWPDPTCSEDIRKSNIRPCFRHKQQLIFITLCWQFQIRNLRARLP